MTFPNRSCVEFQRSYLFVLNKKKSALSLFSSTRVKICGPHFLSWDPISILYVCKWHLCLHISLNWGVSHSLLHSNPCSQQLPHTVFCSSSFCLLEFSCIYYRFLPKSQSQSSKILTFSVATGRASKAVLPVASSAAVTLTKIFLRLWRGLIPLGKDTSISLVPMATNSSVTLQYCFSHSKKEKKFLIYGHCKLNFSFLLLFTLAMRNPEEKTKRNTGVWSPALMVL